MRIPGFLARFGSGQADAPVITATLPYLAADCTPVTYMNDEARSVVVRRHQRVPVTDARSLAEAPSLVREGFACVPHRTAVDDFRDLGKIRDVYFAEVRQLLRDLTGQQRVFMHPNVIVRSKEHRRAYDAGIIVENVAQLVHCDLTDVSTWTEAAPALRTEGLSEPPSQRMLAFNVWRSLTPGPLDAPLAMCDVRSVDASQQVRMRVYGHPNNLSGEGEIYALTHDPAHRWFYYSDLSLDEVLVFQQRDTLLDGVSGVPHTAFDHAVRGAKVPRLSIEARAFVFCDS